MAHVVDIHCHTFNADDLPVRGFLQRVAFHNAELGRDLADLADVLIQNAAPGYLEEKRHLDALLTDAGARAGLGAESLMSGGSVDFEMMVEADFSRLAASEPALLRRISGEMPSRVGASGDTGEGAVEPDFGAEGPADWLGSAKRAIGFVRLFGMRRIDVTARMVRLFGEVDLFTPMLVDLGMGLHDEGGTTMPQQVELQEKISRLSMLGMLPGTREARIHPLVGFDPRREMLARRTGDVQTSLQLLETAVERYGFVGVKLYPPMGWRPLGNERTRDMTADEARKVEGILHEFYEWCEDEDVPITAHCNTSNGAHSDYMRFSDPQSWGRVLAAYPRLHLNLGHFGGTSSAGDPAGWPHAIARLATEHGGHLYADVGNHRLDDGARASAYLQALHDLFKEPETAGMRDRLMYGSDWFMLAALPAYEEFFTRYARLYDETFGDRASTERFLGGAALEFLFGRTGEENKNRKRLRKRYEDYAPDRMPQWLPSG